MLPSFALTLVWVMAHCTFNLHLSHFAGTFLILLGRLSSLNFLRNIYSYCFGSPFLMNHLIYCLHLWKFIHCWLSLCHNLGPIHISILFFLIFNKIFFQVFIWFNLNDYICEKRVVHNFSPLPFIVHDPKNNDYTFISSLIIKIVLSKSTKWYNHCGDQYVGSSKNSK